MVSKNVKYIAVTLRDSKLQVFKVRSGPDLNPGLSRESLNIGKLTLAGGLGSNPGQADLKTFDFEALELTVIYFTFLETSNLFLFGQERSRL